MVNLCVLRYHPSGVGCPAYFSGRFSPDEFEWDPDGPWSGALPPKKAYKYHSKIPDVRFDFYLFAKMPVVSADFLAICESLGVSADPVPLEIELPGRRRPAKSYFILLLRDHLEALDRERSTFVDATDMETGGVLSNPMCPGAHNYERIDSFVVKDHSYPPVFVSIETGDLFCTDEVGRRLRDAALLGLSIEALDERYVYDPIGNLLAP